MLLEIGSLHLKSPPEEKEEGGGVAVAGGDRGTR